MSYAIGNIIYGYPLGQKATDWLNANCKSEIWDEDIPQITTLYSGGSDLIPGYIGVKLGQIDEATDAIRLDFDEKKITQVPDGGIDEASSATPFSVVPTSKQIKEVHKMYADIPDGLAKTLPPVGIYLVWSTS